MCLCGERKVAHESYERNACVNGKTYGEKAIKAILSKSLYQPKMMKKT